MDAVFEVQVAGGAQGAVGELQPARLIDADAIAAQAHTRGWSLSMRETLWRALTRTSASYRMSIAVPRIRPLPRTSAAIYGFTRGGSGDCPVARAGAGLGDRARHVVPLAA